MPCLRIGDLTDLLRQPRQRVLGSTPRHGVLPCAGVRNLQNSLVRHADTRFETESREASEVAPRRGASTGEFTLPALDSPSHRRRDSPSLAKGLRWNRGVRLDTSVRITLPPFGCVVQRQDTCLQSRRWLFNSVRTHYRGSQVVNGGVLPSGARQGSTDWSVGGLKTRYVGFRRFESCPRYCAAIPKWPKGDG